MNWYGGTAGGDSGRREVQANHWPHAIIGDSSRLLPRSGGATL